MKPAGLAGNLFQFIIEADCVALELGDIRVAVQGVKAASGMEQLPPMARDTVRSAVTASQVG